jgi:hypothetical protein
MRLYKPEIIECDRCGEKLYELSAAQAQRVAHNPYNFIMYCKWCQKDIIKELEEEAY